MSNKVKRPPVRMIAYICCEYGNPHVIEIGKDGVTQILETEEFGEFGMIPWVEVWAGDSLRARFSQNKLEHIFYVREEPHV